MNKRYELQVSKHGTSRKIAVTSFGKVIDGTALLSPGKFTSELEMWTSDVDRWNSEWEAACAMEMAA